MSLDKTYWSTTHYRILRILLIDSINQMISIPLDKITKTKEVILSILQSKKITVHKLQNMWTTQFPLKVHHTQKSFCQKTLYIFFNKYETIPSHQGKYWNERRSEDLAWISQQSRNILQNLLLTIARYFQQIIYPDSQMHLDQFGFGGIWENEWFQRSVAKILSETM